MLHTGGGWGDSPLLCKALWVPRKALYKCNELLLFIIIRVPISPSGHYPVCIRTSSRNSEAADSNIFMCGIYKHQQPVNGGCRDRSCFCCVSWVSWYRRWNVNAQFTWLKEHEYLTKSPMTTCSVIIEAEKKTQCCTQQVNAVITVFHVRGVNICTWLFKNCFIGVLSAYTYVTSSSYRTVLDPALK